MGIVVPETCWASNKICNKNLCCIYLAFYFHIFYFFNAWRLPTLPCKVRLPKLVWMDTPVLDTYLSCNEKRLCMGHGSLCLCVMRGAARRFAICVNLDAAWTLSPIFWRTFSVFINIQHKHHFSEAFRKVTASETLPQRDVCVESYYMCLRQKYVGILGRASIDIMKCVNTDGRLGT